MPLILAVEPDRHQASHLASVLRGRPRTELVIAQSAQAALDALGGRVPEVLLTSPLLSRNDEDALASWLRELGPAAAHVQELTIPILAKAAPAKKPRGMLSSLRRSKKSTPDGCEPALFADHVGQYVSQAMAARPDQEMPAPAAVAPPLPQPAVVHAVVETEQELPEITAPAAVALLQPDHSVAQALTEPEIEIIEPVPVAQRPEPEAPVIHALVMPEPEPVIQAFVMPEPDTTVPVSSAWLVEPEPVVIHAIVMPEPEQEPTATLSFAQPPDPEPLVIQAIVMPEPETTVAVSFVRPAEAEPVVIQAIAMPEPEITAPVPVAQLSPWEPSVVDAVEEPAESVWILMPPPAPVQAQRATTLEAEDDANWAAISLDDPVDSLTLIAESPVVEDAGEPAWMLMPVPEFHIVDDHTESAADEAPVAAAVVLLTPLYDLPAEPIAPVAAPLVPVEVVTTAPVTAAPVVTMRPVVVAIEPDVVPMRGHIVETPDDVVHLPVDDLTLPAEVRTLPAEVIEIPADAAATVLIQGPARAAAPRLPVRPPTVRPVRPAARNPFRPAATAPPARPTAVAAPADTSRRRTAAPSKPKRAKRPVQDEWGLFDPTQCGFAALLDKLDEVTANSESDEANAAVSVRIVSY
jgi:hypothetical protein